jgi:hypothetical protein
MAIIDLANLPSLKKVKAGRVWEKTSRSPLPSRLSPLTPHLSPLTSHLSPRPCTKNVADRNNEDTDQGRDGHSEHYCSSPSNRLLESGIVNMPAIE